MSTENSGPPDAAWLFGGLSGVNLVAEEFEIDKHVVIRRTYAHLFAHPMMAFAPPRTIASPHPAPWRATTGGGFVADIHAQVAVHREVEGSGNFNRLNTIWQIIALFRIRCSPHISVPVVSDTAFSSAATSAHQPHLWAMETGVPLGQKQPRQQVDLNVADLQWIADQWNRMSRLCKNAAFNRAFQSFDGAQWSRRYTDAVIVLWGALEQLFSKKDQELRFRVATTIACYLKPPGEEREKLFRQIAELYNQRSKIAHGGEVDEPRTYQETYNLLRSSIMMILERDEVPSIARLESNIFKNEFW